MGSGIENPIWDGERHQPRRELTMQRDAHPHFAGPRTEPTPPPIQCDGLEHARYAAAYAAAYDEARRSQQPSSPQPAGQEGPHFSLHTGSGMRARVSKAHRRLSPAMIFIGYITSAATGIGLGYLVISSKNWEAFAAAVRGLFSP